MKIRNRIIAFMLAFLFTVTMMYTGTPMQAAAADSTKIQNLKVNYEENALGVDTDNAVRFSWNMLSNVLGQEQKKYCINVYEGSSTNGNLFWTSKSITSSKSSGIAYKIPGLKKETKYTWDVIVTTKDGRKITSNPDNFITDTDFSDTSWIIPKQDGKSTSLLRTEQALTGKKVACAYLYISSMGIYTAYIDGKEVKIGSDYDDIFNPGWTDYKYYTNYQTYDVTNYIKDNKLTLGVELGNGWYAGKIGAVGAYQTVFGPDDKASELGLIAKVVVHYTDGTVQYIKTDTNNWKSSTYSAVTANDFYDGESYDANIEEAIKGWNNDGYMNNTNKSPQWSDVTSGVYKGELRSGTEATARIASEYDRKAVSGYTYNDIENVSAENAVNDYGAVTAHNVDVTKDISLKAGDNLIVDFGQNAAGAVKLTVNGTKDTTVTMVHSEMLNDGRKNTTNEKGGSDGPKGTLYLKAITNAAVTDTYKLSDEGIQTFLPTYTSHGFRYVKITADADVVIKNVVAKSYTSVGEQTGNIETNNSNINQLFSNTLWSQKSNYVSLPTDCPQRGERMGWTGDAQLFAATGVYNYDVYSFLENYIDIMQEHASQNDNKYGSIMPSGFLAKFASMVASGWSDAGVIIPWVLYQQTGDTTLINKYYNQMDAYMDYVNQNGYNSNLFGDWLSFSGASTPYLNSVYQIYCTSLMQKMASVLGKTDYANKYSERYNTLKAAFMKKYVDINGNVLSSTADNITLSYHKYPVVDNAQTAILWALKCGLYDSTTQRNCMIANLIKNIKNENGSVRPGYAENTLSVGFLGVNVILPVLTDIGAVDVAYDLLLQDAMPSWLYSVKNGATTTWERWNSYSTENSFGDSGMNSFNHYSYGACVEWMFKYMGGITEDEQNPGFQYIILQPSIDQSGRINKVTSSYDSLYGTIVSNWKSKSGKMSSYHIVIPANTEATMYLDVSETVAKQLASAKGIIFDGMKLHNNKQMAKFAVESGSYNLTKFTVKPVVKLNVKSLSLTVNKTSKAVKATGLVSGDSILKWTSSNKSIAAVDKNGNITAKHSGKAVITVTTKKGATAKCILTVIKKI